MKIAFLGLKQAFDYFQIGGTENFVRRLAIKLLEEGHKVDYLLYRADEDRELVQYGINLRYIKTFDNALDLIKTEKYEHVISIYLLPKDRIKYAIFRKKTYKWIKFHLIYFNWPDSVIKRYLYLNEAKFFPYNGKLFCISKRQYDYVSRWTKNAVYLLPPVPKGYFLKSEEKPINKKIKITFLGRIDPGKGIGEVIEIFKALKNDNRFDCSIYGIHIPEHKESVQVHNWLKSQNDIKYIEVDRQRYSPDVDKMVRNVLKETDILILPYQKLSSTIDTPLTLLEAMASLCVVITKPFGNIPDIYGESQFIISRENFMKDTIDILKGISYEDILKERERIYSRNNNLNFESSNVAKRFLHAIKDCGK